MAAFLYFLLTILLINNISAVNSLAMSADGKQVLTGSYFGKLHSFNEIADGSWSCASEINDWTIKSLVISLSHQMKIVCFERNILKAIKDGKSKMYHLGCNGREIAMSANGKYTVAGDCQGNFIIFESDEKNLLRPVCQCPYKYYSPVHSINITNDGQEVRVCFVDGEILIYSRMNNAWYRYELVSSDPDKSKMWITSIASTPDGRLLIGGTADGKVYIWQKDTQNKLVIIGSLSGSKLGSICSLAISQDGTRVVSGSLHGEVQLWQSTSLTSWHIMGSFPSAQVGHATVAMSADGKRIVKSVGADLEIWQSESNTEWLCIYGAKDLE